jgi:hypothetical protein
MGMTVQRRKDSKTPNVIMHKVADIRGGVSVKASELGGDYLREGAVLSAADENGICHVVKIAEIVADVKASEKTLKVKKYHNLEKGNFVMAGVGGVAYDITDIDGSNKEYDVITVSTALGALSKGAFIAEAAAKSTGTDSALKYVPQSIAGTGKLVLPNQNIDTDAWLIAVTKGNPLPDFVASYLKGIVNY